MKTSILRIASLAILSLTSQAAPETATPSSLPATSPAPSDKAVYRVWTDSQGRKIEATFRGIEDGKVFLQIKTGMVYRLELSKLSAADQQVALTLKPEGLGIPVDPNLAQAAAKIDFLALLCAKTPLVPVSVIVVEGGKQT